MRDGLLREIETEYEVLRSQNHAEESRRLAEATEADRMIGTLVSERARLFQDGARAALANPKEAKQITERMSARMGEIQQELRDRLTVAGFSAEYLQPVYHCPHCHDTGYVGELVRERCSCLARKIRERASGNNTGHGLDPRETFAAYDESLFGTEPLKAGAPRSQREIMAEIRRICETYAQEYPHNERRNLLLVGSSGLGKTYLLNCIGNHARQSGGEVLKLTAYQLSERTRAAVFDRTPEAFSSLLEVPLLMLDDLGVEPLYSNITVEYLFTLLNERLLSGKHTVISTNLMLDELKVRYTERITSRLYDRRNTVMMLFQGRDLRMR